MITYFLLLFILFVISVGWLLDLQHALGDATSNLNKSMSCSQGRDVVPNRIQTRRYTIHDSTMQSKDRNSTSNLNKKAKPFRCECGRAYGSLCSLQGHKRWECGKEPSFKCPLCPYMAKQKSNVTKHVRTKHAL